MFPLLALALGLSGCSPKEEEQLVIEAELSELERIDDRLFLPDTETAFTGLMLDRYPDDALKSRSELVDGKLHGVSEGWYPDGALQVREEFVHGVSHGERTRWFADGQMQSEARIVDGQLHGTFRRWHTNGALAEQIEMKHGQPNGVSLAFFPSGHVRAQVLLDHGEVVEQRFWDDGELTEAPRLSHGESKKGTRN